MDVMIIFATNVKKFLQYRKMTLKELSEKSGISLTFLTKTLNHCNNISLKSVGKISKVLNIPPELFFEHDWDKNILDETDLPEQPHLPDNYEYVSSAILNQFQAYRVKEWDKETREILDLPPRYHSPSPKK